MSNNPAAAPWETETFEEFLDSIEFPSWLTDLAKNGLADRRELDVTVFSKMSEAFHTYMAEDFSCASMARMITAQGYETVNNANTFIETVVNGRPTIICLTGCGICMPEGRKRVIALGPWNVSRRNGIDHYPYFAAGVMKSIDPMFNKRPEL